MAKLFGWKRADGTRRFRRGYIEVPKKNGKSMLFSGLSLYLLVGDGEPGAEVYSAAVDRDQASIVYNEAANMVEASSGLTSRLSVVRSTKRIVFPKTRSFYKALSADVPAKEGLNAHAVLIDQLHAQKTRELWDTLRYAGASRRQPLHLSVTTAGFDRLSICWEMHTYAEQVLSGLIYDSAFFAYISAAGPDDDWTDPKVWKDANPSFGITLSADQFAEDCREAQESPAKENSFRGIMWSTMGEAVTSPSARQAWHRPQSSWRRYSAIRSQSLSYLGRRWNPVGGRRTGRPGARALRSTVGAWCVGSPGSHTVSLGGQARERPIGHVVARVGPRL